MFEYDEYEHDFYVTNMDLNAIEALEFYRKRGTYENYIKESKYDMNYQTANTEQKFGKDLVYRFLNSMGID